MICQDRLDVFCLQCLQSLEYFWRLKDKEECCAYGLNESKCTFNQQNNFLITDFLGNDFRREVLL